MTESISFAAKVAVPADVLQQEVEGEAVVLNLSTGGCFTLDAVANVMWNALVGSDTVEDACQVVAGQYDVDEHLLREDLQALVAILLEHGLLEITTAVAPDNPPPPVS